MMLKFYLRAKMENTTTKGTQHVLKIVLPLYAEKSILCDALEHVLVSW